VSAVETVSHTEPEFDSAEVRERAAVGVGYMTFQGAAIGSLAFLGNVVLARLLVPEDFGVLAFGLALMFFATAIADGGVAAP